MIEPYFETKRGKLYCGDCLEVIGKIPVLKVNAIITDPPFAFTGGISNGSSSNISDQFFIFWWKAVCEKIKQITDPAGSGFIWCDWKTAKLISDGFEPKEQTYDYFRVSQMIYHYREMPGQGQPFRSSVDMIAYIRGPKHKEPPISNTTHNFISSYWYYGKHKYHPAEKSPVMVEKFISWCSREGDTILDLFFGSGVVGVVAENMNRQWIGVEISEQYCETAKKRILSETRQRGMWNMEDNQPSFLSQHTKKGKGGKVS